MPEISKYIKSESVELHRSEIRFADYNPRRIDPENLKTLKKGIRKYGMVGGLVVNKQTGNTLVSGHQRLTAMDELQKYNPDTHENDYLIRCDLVDIDEKAEKELLILLNNPNAQGEWDYDMLKTIIPDIDYSAAGLTDADLSIIGVDTEYLDNLSATYNDILLPDDFQRVEKDEPEQKETTEEKPQPTYEDKVQHMKEVKEAAKQQAQERAEFHSSYFTVSFDNMENLLEFCEIFGIEPASTVKGEELLEFLMENFEQ